MLVSEAKEKVCPFILQYSQKCDSDGIEVMHFNSKCICGDCMAWVKIRMNDDEGYCARIPND